MKTTASPRLALLAVAAGLSVALTGCVGFGLHGPRKTEKSSSIVDYLYPKQAEPLIAPAVPVLNLPLRVGIAFVPASGGRGFVEDFSAEQKTALLQRVADRFRGNAFIGAIETIPSTYLRAGGSFENLDQVRSLLRLDVVVLVAYDQLQFTDPNKLSLAYWTIVGAYVFEGNKNDTHTMLEAVVYDIPSRQLLFRAPGADRLKASSTGVQVREKLRRDSDESFRRAADDLIVNLDRELAAFKERVKQQPEQVQIRHRPGYSGGGAAEGWFALAAGALLFGAWMKRRCA